MDIVFPIKGLNTNMARVAQPDGTSPSLLNVVAFDRDYRLRGAIRPGTSKYSVTQMGSGSQPVLLVEQVTRALDPSTIVPDTTLLNETFTYSNGALNSVAGSTWQVTNTYSIFGGSLSNNASISSNHVTSAGPYAARYLPSLTLGAAYIISMDVTVPSVSAGIHAAIAFRSNTSSLNDGIFLDIANTGSGTTTCDLGFRKFNFNSLYGSAVTVATGVVPSGVSFRLELRVNGDSMTGWIDGIQYLGPITITDFGGNSDFGFMADPAVQGLTIDNFMLVSGSPLATFRETSVIAVCGGNIYTGTNNTLAVAASGTGALSETIKPQMAYSKGICYFVDTQSHLKVLTLANKTVSDITVSTGSETATTLGKYSLAATWRDRLVLAASVATPQNFIMSRQGDQTDWDYAQTDAAAAVAGNASKAGAIGEPLNCLIPWTDDVLILGGDHSIYKVEGDIANGGQILLLSDAVGTLGADCWDADPQGNVYFVGSGGLYQLTPAGLPTNLANDSVREFFATLNRVEQYITLTWDRDRNGLHIHVTPVNTGVAMHMFYDATTQGFFPIQYPDVFGPLTAITFDGDGPEDRQVLLATRDGYIRKIDATALDDDGTNITSYVYMGPFRPAGDAALSVLEALEILLGDAPIGFTESDFQLSISVIVAKDVYAALNSPARVVTFPFTKQGRRKRLLQRISGGTFFFKISGVGGKLWSMEKLVALFTEGGLQRQY